MSDQFLNHELIELLKKHQLSQSELARRINSRQNMISNICYGRRNLGEKLFLKILRKGFRLPEKKVEQLFARAVKQKYLDDPKLK